MGQRVVMHLADGAMLVQKSVSEWVERFTQMAGTAPTEIVLPGVTFAGPTWDSVVHDRAPGLEDGNTLVDWIEHAREAVGDDVKLWACVIPSLGFIGSESLMVVNQYGARLDMNACITNPTVQRIVATFVDEFAEFGLNGVVFYLTDIYPNSGSNAFEGLSNTCFCNHCLRGLVEHGWSEGLEPFLGASNLTRVVLRDGDNSSEYIFPQHGWIEEGDGQALLLHARTRRILDTERSMPDDAATQLLAYMGSRSKLTASSVAVLGAHARECELVTAVISANEFFDMTQCVTLPHLHAIAAVDEYWLPLVDEEYVATNEIAALQYLYRRGPYTLNAFFEFLGGAHRILLSLGAAAFLGQMSRVARTVVHGQLSKGAIFAAGVSDEYAGVVGVPIQGEDVTDLLAGLIQGEDLQHHIPKEALPALLESVAISHLAG